MKRKWKMLLTTAVLTLAMTALTSCSDNSPKEDAAKASPEATAEAAEDTGDSSDSGGTAYPLTITDSLGNEVTIEEKPERVISLAPATTEILFALGAGDRVKGRTDYCSYPEEAAAVESIGTYTSPNTELIISMEPDVIFASDYIDDNIRRQVEAAGAKVVVFSANSIEEVQDVIAQCGQILDLDANAEELAASMDADLQKIEALTAGQSSPSVFVDIGSFYSAGPGSLLGDMLERLHVTNIAADTEEAYPQLSVETIIEKDPDIYISLYSTPEELKATAGLSDLDCIKNDRIIFYEALSNEADMIQRPGPRVVQGLQLLAGQIYEEAQE